MTLEELFADKSLKSKDRSAQLQRLLDDDEVEQPALIIFAGNAKAPVKATCLEGLEYVTKTRPVFLTAAALDRGLRSWADKEPRVKRESARVKTAGPPRLRKTSPTWSPKKAATKNIGNSTAMCGMPS